MTTAKTVRAVRTSCTPRATPRAQVRQRSREDEHDPEGVHDVGAVQGGGLEQRRVPPDGGVPPHHRRPQRYKTLLDSRWTCTSRLETSRLARCLCRAFPAICRVVRKCNRPEGSDAPRYTPRCKMLHAVLSTIIWDLTVSLIAGSAAHALRAAQRIVQVYAIRCLAGEVA